MENLIVMQREDLDRLLKKTVREALEMREPVKERMSIDDAVAYLNENGLIISKSTLYKNTMKKTIPFSRFGDRRIVFSAKELDAWVDAQLTGKQSMVTESVRWSARKKL